MPPAHPPDDQSPDRPDVERALRDLGPGAERLKRTPDTLARDDADADADAKADTFAGYDIIRELHRGGQGIVYLAVQRSTHRKVALKVMREGPLASPSSPARFEREIRVLGQLNHPNIVTIHDSGRSGSNSFFVMDYVSGQALDEWARELKGEPRERISQILRLFAKICDAVQAAHRRGVVHRDLKPSNIRVDFDGEPRVLDFGVAKIASEEDSSLMTLTGQFVGSLPWASPEQAEGHPDLIDSRTDVYSLGVILYSLLTGQFPYDVTGTMRDVLDRIARTPPARPRSVSREIDGEVETILLKALSKERERRYETAGEFGDDVRRYLQNEPIMARRDSMLYLFRTRGRRVVGNHPVGTSLIVLVFSTLAAQFPGNWTVFVWTPANKWFVGALHGMLPSRSDMPLGEVVLFEIRDYASLDVAAWHEALRDVNPRSKVASLRRLHGRFMEKLVRARPRVVVWDIHFKAESKYDEEFARGVEALRRAGIDVVVGVEHFTQIIGGVPAVAPRFLNAGVKWGCLDNEFGPDGWLLPLAMQREGEPVRPSLPLITFASTKHPGANTTLQFDAYPAELHHVTVEYAVPDPANASVSKVAGPPDSIWLTYFEFEADPPNPHIVKGMYAVDVPTDFARRTGTLDYGEAFTCSPDELQAICEGKIVLVGDARPDAIDRFEHPSGGKLPGCYGLVAAIESLFSNTPVRSLTLGNYLVNGCAAALGILLARLRGGRAIPRWAWNLGLTGLFTAISVAAYWWYRYLCNPLVPALALILASELIAWRDRLRSADPSSFVKGKSE